MNQKTCSGEFKEGFSMFKKDIEKSDYENLAYYGEYPLCLAALFANKDIYDYLIGKGADPNLLCRYT